MAMVHPSTARHRPARPTAPGYGPPLGYGPPVAPNQTKEPIPLRPLTAAQSDINGAVGC